jgi:hypothetical protein
MIIPGTEEKAFVQSSHRDEELLPLDQVRIWHPFNFLLLTGPRRAPLHIVLFPKTFLLSLRSL